MASSGMHVMGLAGWSGAGKTTLLGKLIPALVARGVRVATVKHAHHAFDIDQPGKDSWTHRAAGASEVIVSSARRWAHIHELRDEPEPRLSDLLRRLSPCDVVLVEGFKRQPHAKIEVFRAANGREPLHVCDGHVVAVASDQPFPLARVPVVPLDDVEAIRDVVLALAEPIEAVLKRLEAHGAAQ
jgi:molybdopterin-guanine dinucleotide biosynthesis adapter protein